MSAIYYGNDANGLFYGADTERKGLPDRPTQSAEAPARARPFARPGRGFPGPGPRSGPASLASGRHRGLQRVVCLWGQGPRGALGLLPRLLSETETAAARPPPGRRPRAPSPTPKAAPCHLLCWGPGDPQESLRLPQCSDLGAAWPRDKGGHRLPAFTGASGSRTEVFLGPLNDRNPDPAVRSETWALGGDRRGAETPACQ